MLGAKRSPKDPQGGEGAGRGRGWLHGCNEQNRGAERGSSKGEDRPGRGPRRRWRPHGLAGVRGSQTGRKRGGNDLAKRLRSLARANDAARSDWPTVVTGCGRPAQKYMKILRQSAGDRSMTAGPRSRQAGLRRCDRANPLGKRVCGLACKQFSSLDQDRAKHVGLGAIMGVQGRKDQRGSHTRPSFDRLGIRLLSTAPFGVRSSRLPAGPPKRGQENEPCRNVPTNRTTPAANEPTVSVPAWRRRTAEKFWPTVAVKVASASRSAAVPSSRDLRLLRNSLAR